MPNTWSTPSALRHSMMASTARMTARVLSAWRIRLPGQPGGNYGCAPGPAGRLAKAGQSNSAFSRSELISCGSRRLRKVQIGSAAHADLIRDRHDVAAVGALPEWILLLVAIQQRREDAH